MQHNALEETALYKLFYEFGLSIIHDEDKAELFAKELDAVFKEHTHRIVTTSSNLSDGIGDYSSHVYFIEKITRLLAEYKNVDLKNISYVSAEKQPFSKILRENKINEESVCVLGNDNDDYDYSQKTSFVGVPNKKEKKILSSLMNEADFIFNFAVGLTSGKEYKNQLGIQNRGAWGGLNPVRHAIIPAKNNAFAASWVQYSFLSNENKNLNDDYASMGIDFDYKGPIFSEYPMGIHKNQTGLRFDKTILATIKKNRNELLASLSDGFKKHAFNNINLQDQTFAIGYLQSGSASHAFALIAIQTSPEKRDMNILVNLDHFLSCPEKNKLLFENGLRELGVTTIEFIKKDEIIEPIKLTENPENPYTLRLINFKGISDSDKAVLYNLAEMVGASGDNSITEMVTVGLKPEQTSLPFPQVFITSNSSCIQSILEEVKDFETQTGDNHGELCMYLQYLIKQTSHPSYKLVQFHYDKEYAKTIKLNREKITKSWHKFCEFLYLNRNNDKYFNELLVNYVFHHLLTKNDLNTFMALAKMLGENAFKNETLLHMAVKANNRKAVAFVLKNKLCDINQRHPFNEYTVLHMAAFLENREIVELLIQNGIDVQARDQHYKKAIHIAVEKSHFDIFKILLEIESVIDARFNRQEMLGEFLCEAVRNNNRDAIQAVLKEGADINYPNYYSRSLETAIESNDVNLVEFLLINGANPNLGGDSYSLPLFSAYNKPEIFKILLKYNGDLNALCNGRTLIGCVCDNDKVEFEVLEILLNRGADVNQKVFSHLDGENDVEETILHAAARSGNIKLITFLLSHGANSILENSKQQTALEVYLLKCNNKNPALFSEKFNKNKEIIIKAFESARKDKNYGKDKNSGCRIF